MQRQQLAYRERNLTTRNNGIAKAVLQQKLGTLESLGQTLVHVLLDHARAGKCRQGIGLGQDNVASMAKLAVTPPVVGSVSTVIYRPPASLWRLTAAEILAICMSEVTPSCMRAPPDTVKPTTGSPNSAARSKT